MSRDAADVQHDLDVFSRGVINDFRALRKELAETDGTVEALRRELAEAVERIDALERRLQDELTANSVTGTATVTGGEDEE